MFTTYRTRKAAVAASRRLDADGTVILEGKGSHLRPWLLCDADVAEDLLSDDVERARAQYVVSHATGPAYVITLADCATTMDHYWLTDGMDEVDLGEWATLAEAEAYADDYRADYESSHDDADWTGWDVRGEVSDAWRRQRA